MGPIRRTNPARDECPVPWCSNLKLATDVVCKAHLANRRILGEGLAWMEWALDSLPMEKCWEWPFSRNHDGYGTVSGNRAHRVMLEMTGQMLLPGYEVMHACDNPPCVNPRHLRQGTHAENMADMRAKGRANDFGHKGSSRAA